MLWLSGIAGGFICLERYSFTPGRSAQAPLRWPHESALKRALDRPTLLLFAHPKCPCTQASLGELAVLMAHLKQPVTAYAVFCLPDPCPPGWNETDLWRDAENIPGVTACIDAGAKEGGRFGSYTSGQVLLYNAQGELSFSGGITESRGHFGDNEGRLALARIIDKTPPFAPLEGGIESSLEGGEAPCPAGTSTFPVFGCELCGPSKGGSKGSSQCLTRP